MNTPRASKGWNLSAAPTQYRKEEYSSTPEEMNMNKLLVVAAFLIVPLAGCAAADGSKPAARAASMAAGTYFCWKDKLNPQGDALVCNWEGSVGDACKSGYSSSLARSAISTGPSDAGRCSNGQWLVQVTTK
jgi:hypothetical protein